MAYMALYTLPSHTLILSEVFLPEGIGYVIHWNQLKSIFISQCSYFKVAWAVSRASVNSESCSSSNLCCGQRFVEAEGRKEGQREKRGRQRKAGVGVHQHHAVIASTPSHRFTPARWNHPFSPQEINHVTWRVGKGWMKKRRVNFEFDHVRYCELQPIKTIAWGSSQESLTLTELPFPLGSYFGHFKHNFH